MPAVKKALAAKASALERPASSRKMVLMPQMKEDARVLIRVSASYVRSTLLAGSLSLGSAAMP